MSTLGSSGVPSQHTVNYDALLSTTFFAYREKMIDNIFRKNAFLAAIREFDGIIYKDGGERIMCPLLWEENDTVQTYRGYEQLNVTPQDGITAAFYPWVEMAGTITISRLEERQNSGEARLLGLLESKIKQAEGSIRQKTNTQLVGGTASDANFRMIPGNDGKDLLPLGYFLGTQNSLDPVGTGVEDIGNISQNSFDFWRNKSANLGAAAATGQDFGLAVTTYKGLIIGLKRMYNFCARGAAGAPTIVVADQFTYEEYESAVDERSRIQNTRLGQIGWETLKLKGAEMIWDETVPDLYGDGSGTPYEFDSASVTTGSAFFIDTEYMKLCIDKETDFVTTPFIVPENQTAKTAKILFMGNLTCDNLRKVGSVNRISRSIVA